MAQKTKRSILWVQKNQNQQYAGIHLIADFWYGKTIEDEKEIKKILIGAAKSGKSRPLEIIIHKFNPQGMTGIVLLAESHIALHFWPEFNYLAIDIFTCGDKATPFKALQYLKKKFRPKRVEVQKIKRGNHAKIEKFIS